MTMSNVPVLDNPYGYGANTLEKLHRYLTRHVRNVPFASEEDLYADKVVTELRRQVTRLESELQKLKQQKTTTSSENKTDINVIKEQYEYERMSDTQRLEYCMTHEVVMIDGCIYANLDTEKVIDGDFRAALDRLIGARQY
jgi:ribosomal protein L29